MMTPGLALLFLLFSGSLRAEPADAQPDPASETAEPAETPLFAPSATEVAPDAEARLAALVAAHRGRRGLEDIAKQLSLSGDARAAAAAYEALFRQDPDSPEAEEALRAAVTLHAEAGRLAQAVALRGLWLETFPDGDGRADALQAQARDRARTGDWDDAAIWFGRLAGETSSHPRAPDALLRVAAIREAQGDVDAAERALARWLARYGDRPERPWVAAERGRLLEATGDWRRAEAHWRAMYTDLGAWGGEVLTARLRCADALTARGLRDEAAALVRESADWYRAEGLGDFGVDPAAAARLLALEVRLEVAAIRDALPADDPAWFAAAQAQLTALEVRARAVAEAEAGAWAVQALVDLGGAALAMSRQVAPEAARGSLDQAARLALEDRAASAWRDALALDHAHGIYAPDAARAWASLMALRPLEHDPLLEALPEPVALDGAGALWDPGQIAPGDPHAERALADAEAQIRALLLEQPARLEAHQSLVLLHLRYGQLGYAELVATEALGRFAHTAAMWNAVGVARWRAADPDGAARAWRRALALDPRSATANTNVGLLALRAMDYDGAVEHFRTALGRDRERADALRGLAVAFRGAGELDEPPRIYRYLTRAHRDHAPDALNAAIFYADYLGEFRKARWTLKRFLWRNRGALPADHPARVRLLGLERDEIAWRERQADRDALRADQDATLAELEARLAEFEARLAAADCVWSEATGKLAALQNVAAQARDVLDHRAWTRATDLLRFMDAMETIFDELEPLCVPAPSAEAEAEG